MKKEDWKNLVIFLFVLLVTGPLMQTRKGETLLIGNTHTCPVIPTSLCEGNFFIVPSSSANVPMKL